MTTMPGDASASADSDLAGLERLPPGGEAQLSKGALSLFDVLTNTLANMAPAEGIFVSMALVAAAMGTRAPWAFVVAGVAIAATGNTVAEFSRHIPSAGSFVTFIGEGFGRRRPGLGGFLAAATLYSLMLAFPIAVGAVVIFLGSWIAYLFGLPNICWMLISIGAVICSVLLLLRGVRYSVRVAFALFATEALGLLVLSVTLLIRGHAAISAPLHSIGGLPGGFRGLAGITFAIAISGYVGWENSAPLAEETRSPRRAVPRAIALSILVISALYVLVSWSAATGFVAWKGPAAGASAYGDLANPAPFLDLARHFAPWWSWAIEVIGVTSAAGCFIAATLSNARIFFNGGRQRLLPSPVTRTNRHQQPWLAVLIVGALTLLVVVLPYFLISTNPVTDAGDAASVGTTPMLIMYGLANLALPAYMLAAHRDEFRPGRHLAVPLLADLVLGYGVYEFVQPSQPPPANRFWIYILVVLVIGTGGALIARSRRPEGLAGAGSVLTGTHR